MQIQKYIYKNLTTEESLITNNASNENEANHPLDQEALEDILSTLPDSVPPLPDPIVTYSQNELDEVKAASYNEGYSAGYNTATEKATEELHQVKAALENNITDLLANIYSELKLISEQSTLHYQELETATTELAFKIAQKVAKESLQQNAITQIQSIVKQALAKLQNCEEITIKVNTELHAKINEALNDSIYFCGFQGTVNIKADADISPGDCIISWDNGYIKRNIANTWQEIESVIGRQGNKF